MSWYLLHKRFYLHFPDDKNLSIFSYFFFLAIWKSFVKSLQVFSPFLNLFMFLIVIARVICVFWVCTVDKFSTSSDSVPHLSLLYGTSGNENITSCFPISSLATTLAPIKDMSMQLIKTNLEALWHSSSDVLSAPHTVVPQPQ